MSKSLAFEFAALCGVAYDCGDVRFTPDGSSLLSPVGHRLTRFGLSGGGADSSANTYALETLAPLRRIAITKGCLAVVDGSGRAMLCNPENGAVLHRFNLKGSCSCLEFSPDGLYLACSVGRKVQVWRRPVPMTKSISSMVLVHEFASHSMDISALDWSTSNNVFTTGSLDCTARIQYFDRYKDTGERRQPADWETSVALVGHKSKIVGSYLMKPSVDEPCILTIAEDGAVFEWRFSEKPEIQSKQRAKRKRIHGQNGDGEENDPADAKEWVLRNRHFVQVGSSATITSVATNCDNVILFGFSDGVFSIYEAPSLQKLQSLSASKYALESAAITSDGSWLALASPTLGQLLVWEWLSETFVLRQQGHYYNMNSVAYSPDGRVMATGGDDGKVKVWSTATNTSFVTFTEHEGPVTAASFASNTALVTCGLDGTCRAFDLVRLRNFRTMTPPAPCQLLSLAISDGEVIFAGAMEPPQIYMWSLRTGKLLDTLSGHTGPVSCLDFATNRPVLASSSWDGTIKLWEPFTATKPVESLISARSESAAPVNQLCVAFRPDGKALACAGLDGSVSVWSLEDGSLKTIMDCRRDLGVTDKVNAYFTSLTYSADGRVLLAGGKTSWVYAYDPEREILLKKYSLAQRVRETSDDVLNEDADDARKRRWKEGRELPGVVRGRDAGKRTSMDPEITSSCVRFSPTGRSWGAATPQGLVIFSLDQSLTFDPVNIDEDCTPQSTRSAAKLGDFSKAINQALFLGEPSLISEMVDSVPLDNLPLVSRSIPRNQVARCFEAVAERIEQGVNIEYNLTWALCLFSSMSEVDVARNRSRLLPCFRGLQRSVMRQDKTLSKLCDENLYDLEFVMSSTQPNST